MNSVAKTRPAVTKVKEEMIEDDISDDSDPHLKVTQLEFCLKTSTTTTTTKTTTLTPPDYSAVPYSPSRHCFQRSFLFRIRPAQRVQCIHLHWSTCSRDLYKCKLPFHLLMWSWICSTYVDCSALVGFFSSLTGIGCTFIQSHVAVSKCVFEIQDMTIRCTAQKLAGPRCSSHSVAMLLKFQP